jgi:hypothetical protein
LVVGRRLSGRLLRRHSAIRLERAERRGDDRSVPAAAVGRVPVNDRSTRLAGASETVESAQRANARGLGAEPSSTRRNDGRAPAG